VFYTANNSKLQVNGNEILASNAEISLQANLQPNYNIKQRHTESFTATNGIGGTLSFNYYLTGTDYFKSFITGQAEAPFKSSQVISGNFGGLNFDSGYLTSYSVNFSPNAPAVASASLSFFDQLNGKFNPTTEQAPTDKEVLNFRNAIVAHYIPIENTTLSGSVEDFVAGTYNYQSEVQPVYLMGETKPSSVSFGPKNVNMNFETDNPTGYLPVSGNSARISVDLKNNAGAIVENFTCSGVIRGRNLASAVGDYIKQTINVTQASVQDTNVFVSAIIDSFGGEANVGIGTEGGNI
jgi:hypothetical protein